MRNGALSLWLATRQGNIVIYFQSFVTDRMIHLMKNLENCLWRFPLSHNVDFLDYWTLAVSSWSWKKTIWGKGHVALEVSGLYILIRQTLKICGFWGKLEPVYPIADSCSFVCSLLKLLFNTYATTCSSRAETPIFVLLFYWPVETRVEILETDWSKTFKCKILIDLERREGLFCSGFVVKRIVSM